MNAKEYTPMRQLVIATSSANKRDEIAAILQGMDLQILTLRDFLPIEEPEETGATMADNARLKAEYYSRIIGLPTLADDSGLEVDALNGEPGVRSARWVEGSDADRITALLARLEDIPTPQRNARYRCTLCLITPATFSAPDTSDPLPAFYECEGVCEGRIAAAPRGSHGFGYDPIFEITEATNAAAEWLGQTLGETPPAVKAQISHRARAVAKLVEELR